MPSLQENSPNAVYECLEHGIPFIASGVGGVPELVTSDVLFEPTAAGLEAALRPILAAGNVPPPARPAFDPDASLERWREVIELRPQPRPAYAGDRELHDVLVHAQRVTGADVVTCGLQLPDGGLRFFHGDPGGLGAVENAYGVVALIDGELRHGDELWPVLARLASSGASIVSIPLPLAEGTVEPDPATALRAVQALEVALPEPARGAARLAAGLGAAVSTRQMKRPARRLRRRRNP
jgi:hypothetical protein